MAIVLDRVQENTIELSSRVLDLLDRQILLFWINIYLEDILRILFNKKLDQFEYYILENLGSPSGKNMIG